MSYPPLALLAYTVARLLRCGAADGDSKQQGFYIPTYARRIVTCHRLCTW